MNRNIAIHYILNKQYRHKRVYINHIYFCNHDILFIIVLIVNELTNFWVQFIEAFRYNRLQKGEGRP